MRNKVEANQAIVANTFARRYGIREREGEPSTQFDTIMRGCLAHLQECPVGSRAYNFVLRKGGERIMERFIREKGTMFQLPNGQVCTTDEDLDTLAHINAVDPGISSHIPEESLATNVMDATRHVRMFENAIYGLHLQTRQMHAVDTLQSTFNPDNLQMQSLDALQQLEMTDLMLYEQQTILYLCVPTDALAELIRLYIALEALDARTPLAMNDDNDLGDLKDSELADKMRDSIVDELLQGGNLTGGAVY